MVAIITNALSVITFRIEKMRKISF